MPYKNMTLEQYAAEIDHLWHQETGSARPTGWTPDTWREDYEEGIDPAEVVTVQASYND